MHITNDNIGHLLKGASLLACGGGLAYEAQLKDIKKILSALPISLIPLSDLDDDDPVITICEIGPSDAPPVSKRALPELVGLLSSKYHLPAPKAVLPFEIGQESITLESAVVLKLPIIDSDMAGQRAVPKVGLDLVNLSDKRSVGPVLAVNSKGTVLSITKTANAPQVEQKLRAFAFESKGVVLVISDYQKAKAITPILKHQAYSYAVKLGAGNNSDFSERIKYQADITVTAISPYSKAGFHSAIITATDQSENILTLDTMNEFIHLANQHNSTSYDFPDLIILIDPADGHGVASANIVIGQKYHLLVVASINSWRNASAQQIHRLLY